MKFSWEVLIAQAKIVHNDKYGYPEEDREPYKNLYSKLPVECRLPGHGIFYPSISNHINCKSGCPVCAGNIKLTREEVIRRSVLKYGEGVIDYSEFEYNGLSSKAKLKCGLNTNHGYFYPTVKDHLNKISGCPSCSGRKRLTKESFISDSNKTHSGKYTYNNVPEVIKDNKTPVPITCLTHGDFMQRPDMHKNEGNGCPKCASAISKLELEFREFIQSLVSNTVVPYILKNGKHVDVYCPSLRIGFEFNGVYWHSEQVGKPKDYHLNKTIAAKEEQIRLIHVMEDEWVYKKEIVKNRIRNILGINTEKYFARKTDVVNLTRIEASSFLNDFHIQGSGCPSKFNIGLRNKVSNELIAVMTFNTLRYEQEVQGGFELVRFASRGSVVGGFSKLLKHFTDNNAVYEITSYSDKRWSEGAVYSRNGFVHMGSSKPGYAWFKQDVRYSRESMQKHKLEAKLTKFDPDLSEVQNCTNNGFFRVFDCGVDKWKLSIKNKTTK